MIYVMQVLTGKEAEVKQMLTSFILREDEEIFYPTYEKTVRINGKEELRKARLFPSYLFIKSNDSIDFYTRVHRVKDLHFMQTLTKLLRTDTYIVPITKNEEKSLLTLIGTEEPHTMSMSYGEIHHGQRIIQAGPLAGQEKNIVKIDRHKRIAILKVQLLERQLEIKTGLEVTMRY